MGVIQPSKDSIIKLAQAFPFFFFFLVLVAILKPKQTAQSLVQLPWFQGMVTKCR